VNRAHYTIYLIDMSVINTYLYNNSDFYRYLYKVHAHICQMLRCNSCKYIVLKIVAAVTMDDHHSCGPYLDLQYMIHTFLLLTQKKILFI